MSNKNFYGTPHLNVPSRISAGWLYKKLILGALRVPDANSLMCKFFLGLNEIIVVSKSFTGEHKTHAKVRSQMCCNDNKMYDEKTDKKAAY